jgi:hypothetical protein
VLDELRNKVRRIASNALERMGYDVPRNCSLLPPERRFVLTAGAPRSRSSKRGFHGTPTETVAWVSVRYMPVQVYSLWSICRGWNLYSKSLRSRTAAQY